MMMAVERATGFGRLETAHGALNAAYNALAVDTVDGTLARDYLDEARRAIVDLGGHDGPGDAAVAARAVLPRLEHALVLLDALGTQGDALHVTPLLDELGLAMDHVEQALAAVGWE